MKLKRLLKYLLITALLLATTSIVVYEVFPGVICRFYKYRSFSKTNLSVKKIKIGEKIFSYAEGGMGKTLFFIHGFQGDMNFWTRYLSPFLEKNHIVVLELPAHGNSSCSQDQKFDLQSLATTLNEFVDAKKLENFCLIGTSLGAGAITEFAAKYPSKACKMVLINPIGIRPQGKDYEEVISKNQVMFFPNSMKDLDNLYVYLTGKPFTMGEPIKRYILSHMLSKKDIYQRVYSDLVKSRGVESILPTIGIPTLLLVGQFDKITRSQDVEIYVNKMPNCKAVVIENGYHILSAQPLEKALFEMKSFLN